MKNLIIKLEETFGHKAKAAEFLGYTLRRYSTIRKEILAGEEHKLNARVREYLRLKCRELGIINGKEAA